LTQPSPHNWEAEPFGTNTDSLSNLLDDPLLLREWFLIAWSSEVATGQTVSRRLLGRDFVLSRTPKGFYCDTASARQEHAEEQEANTFQSCEAYGGIWVSLSDEPAELPDYALAETPGFHVVSAGPYRFRSQGHRVIEHALGIPHLGLIQTGLFGHLAPTEVGTIQVADTIAGPPSGQVDIRLMDFAGLPSSHATCRIWLAGPLTAGVESATRESADEPLRFGVVAQVTPKDADICEMRLLVALNSHNEISEEELRKRLERIIEKVRMMIEAHHPEEDQLLSADAMVVAYRKWLRGLTLRPRMTS
jgi:phenylpropionate dioxygenase-like ring-hydroxylating dioxygenase large terminal subunit